VSMLRGDLGQPLGGWPKALQHKALKGAKPINVRPGSLLDEADLVQERRDADAKLGRALDDAQFASWLMYPKVFAEWAAAHEEFGPVSALPTHAFFYGMGPEEEIQVDIEPGKTLVIRCLAIGDLNADKGTRTVFFELNGQPRRVKVQDRASAVSLALRPKAEPEDPTQLGSPIPGVVSALAVKPGQQVRIGDVLLSIEAMKMETALHADRDGEIATVLVKVGDQVDAKDRLLTYC
jgi:pyruvate carboxylase